MSREIRLVPPVTEEQARNLVCGDVVFLDGTVLAWRDRAIERMFELSERGEPFPVNLEGSVHWHCGPIVRKTASGWTVVSAGPTASTRFSLAEVRAIEDFGVRVIVGKGGMFSEAREAMKKKGRHISGFRGRGRLFLCPSDCPCERGSLARPGTSRGDLGAGNERFRSSAGDDGCERKKFVRRIEDWGKSSEDFCRERDRS